jgi:hypothetical protein
VQTDHAEPAESHPSPTHAQAYANIRIGYAPKQAQIHGQWNPPPREWRRLKRRCALGTAYAQGMTEPLLKYCFHGQHMQPAATVKLRPGGKGRRVMCAKCYRLILSQRGKRR